jgi:hypothetical protein
MMDIVQLTQRYLLAMPADQHRREGKEHKRKERHQHSRSKTERPTNRCLPRRSIEGARIRRIKLSTAFWAPTRFESFEGVAALAAIPILHSETL